MQRDKPKFQKNVTTDKKYTLRKMEFNIFFALKCETFGVKSSIKPILNKQKSLNKIMCFNSLRN